MDQNSLVTEAKDEGRTFIDRLDKMNPVKVAFWLKPADADRWYLYFALDSVDRDNLKEGYREVLQLARRVPPLHFDPDQIRIIPAGDPMAQAAQEIQSSFTGPMATNVGSGAFGGMAVDAVYIYPALARPSAA